MQPNATYTWTGMSRSGDSLTILDSSADANWFSTGPTQQGTPGDFDAVFNYVSPSAASFQYSLTPTLVSKIKLAQPGRQNFMKFSVSACTDSTCVGGTEVANSGWIAGTSWTVPSGVMNWGGLYKWNASIGSPFFDGVLDNFDWHPARSFATSIPIPSGQHLGLDNQSPTVAGVNLADRHFEYSVVDAAIATASDPLTITRQYSSSSSAATGAFGPGWASVLDMGLVPTSYGYYVRLPDAHEVAFGRNPDGSFVPAPGSEGMSLGPCSGACQASDLAFVDQSGTKYVFTANRLVKIIDGDLRERAFVYDSAGKISKIVDATTGRSLGVSWSQNRVLQVTLEPAVQGVPSTWNYSYRADRLDSVCPPETRTSCTRYTYNTTSPRTLLAVIAPNGTAAQQVTYDSTRRTVTATNTAGLTTQFTKASDVNSGQKVTATEAGGETSVYRLDQFGRNIQLTDTGGADERWAYDLQGRMVTYRNAVGGGVDLTYDKGRLYSRKTYRDATLTYTQMFAYITTAGPAQGKLWLISDGSQAWSTNTPSPNQALTELQYDSQGRLAAEHQGAPGATRSSTTYSYTTGGEAVCGGGSAHPPAGLLKTRTDPAGNVTTRTYDALGQLCDETDAVGKHTTYGYDGLGRVTAVAETINNSTPTPIANYSYARNGLVASITGPNIADPTTGLSRKTVTSFTYDANYNMLTTTETDAVSAQTRTTSYGYDQYDRVTSVTQPDSSAVSYLYDTRGNVTQATDQNGSKTSYAYNAASDLITTTALGYVNPVTGGSPHNIVLEQRGYDSSHRLTSTTDRNGQVLQYEYYADDLLKKTTAIAQPLADGTTANVVRESYVYDALGNPTQVKLNNDRTVVTNVYDKKSQLTSSAVTVPAAGTAPAATRVLTRTYDLRGLLLTDSIGASATEPSRTTTYVYDNAGRMIKTSVGQSATSTDQAVTYYQRNLRGGVVAITDPRGGSAGDAAWTTNVQIDATGNAVSITAPAPIAGAARPVTKFGYDAFGRQTLTIGPSGERVNRTYDAMNRVLTETAPYFTPAPVGGAPKTSYQYTASGQLLQQTDRAGAVTTNTYDTLDQVVQQTKSPKSVGGTARIWTTQYSDAGQPVVQTSPSGAITYQAFNSLGQRSSAATALTGPSGAQTLTSAYTYDLGGNLASSTSPGGGITTAVYDALNELAAVTDPDGGTTNYAYDYLGQTTKVTDPIGNSEVTAYDAQGNVTALTQKNTTGGTVRSWNWKYDKAGNQTEQKDPRNGVRTFAYDALSRLITQTYEDNSVASIGYDASGNATKYTDPRGNITTATYTAEGATATVVEPSTTAYTSAANRTTAWQYDGAGRVTGITNPGGSTVSRTYDADSNLLTETAQQAAAPTSSTRAFAYDDLDRLVSFSHPNGTQAITYNQIGWITGSTGPAGTATFSYDNDGNITQRSDASGAMSATWTPGGRLATLRTDTDEPLLSNEYDPAGELIHQSWGDALTRDYSYDEYGLLVDDKTRATDGTLLASTGYVYDGAGNVKTRVVGPATAAGAGTTTYTYDSRERLTSWKTPDAVVHTNVWDKANNATTLDGTTRTFDARNRLLTSGSDAFSYNARGDLTSQTGAHPRTLSYDGFSQLTNDGSATYNYDALSRLSNSGTSTFTYAGASQEASTIGADSYGRSPDGALATINGALSVANSHGDITSQITPDSEASSVAYSPLGAAITTVGAPTGSLGFQSDFSSTSGLVNMQARWYDPTIGTFITRDNVALTLDEQNRYSYASGNVTNKTDPTGHCPACAAVPIGAGIAISLETGILIGSGIAALFVGVGAWDYGVNHVNEINAGISNLFTGTSTASSTTTTTTTYTLPLSNAGGVSIPNLNISPISISPINIPKIDLSGLAASMAALAQSMAALAESMAALNESLAQLKALTFSWKANQYTGEHPNSYIVEGVVALSVAAAGGALICGAGGSSGACQSSVSSLGTACAGPGASTAVACLPQVTDIWNSTTDQQAKSDTQTGESQQIAGPKTQTGGGSSGGGSKRPPWVGDSECHEAAPGGKNKPNRPGLTDETKQAIQDDAPKDPHGNFIDPNTGESITGPWEYGHKEGFEWWRTAQVARDQGWTKEQIKAWENEADHYQIEDRSENRSHRWEMKPC
ncbi:GH-E family nuclease [Herbiconiux ginsengi]|nr:GH-E family nuclease [Herbiconiux ginsengi]